MQSPGFLHLNLGQICRGISASNLPVASAEDFIEIASHPSFSEDRIWAHSLPISSLSLPSLPFPSLVFPSLPQMLTERTFSNKTLAFSCLLESAFQRTQPVKPPFQNTFALINTVIISTAAFPVPVISPYQYSDGGELQHQGAYCGKGQSL